MAERQTLLELIRRLICLISVVQYSNLLVGVLAGPCGNLIARDFA